MSDDELRPVPGHPTYSVTRDGRVWSEKRRGGASWIKGKINKRGYRAFTSNGTLLFLGHIAVLSAWVEPRPDGLYGLHRDGDRSNNRVDNLYWGTQSQNMIDCLRHGTNHHQKLTPEQVLEIRASSDSGNVAARKYGVSKSVVQDIRHRRTWKHV